jgi:rod shape-determining protein MreD
MNLPLAAAGATALALIELSVLPSIRIAGLKPDLVLVVVVVIAAVFGLDRALGWAFVGGLLLDVLSAGPYRPIGATAFTLLVVAGLAAATVRFVPGGRTAVTVALGFALAVVYHLLVLGFITLRGVATGDPLAAIVPLAVLDAALAVPVVALAVLVERRAQRQEGLGW